ncbi:MAG: S8 family serine peptidase [Ignavibacteriales bacterium]|nr:S8 family serine peptidase [Ignavibacteriales bacterium]
MERILLLIGVIDTGIDFDHFDLSSQIYFNPGENGIDNSGKSKRSNNIDDDGNGFVDDFMGWDFTDRVGFPFDSTGGDYLDWDNNPKDEQGHGTYIAGISSASINNLYGIAGTAPGSRLLNIRAFDPNGYGEEDDVAAAILYAVQMGAKVINMSFGDNAFSFVLRDIIRYAYSRGVVLIASAGNSGSSNPHYPSGYSEVVCVGNSTSDDFVAGSSNIGSTIDLVAPGSLIITTAMDNNYAVISGTSASAPFVSGAAALILSLENFTNEEIKQILKSTTDDIGTPGWDLKSGAGRLNLFKALSVIAPSKIKINTPFSGLCNFCKYLRN